MRMTAASVSVLAIAIAFATPSNGQPTAPSASALNPPPLRELGTLDVLPTNDVASLAISPDGERIVFAAVLEGRNLLWLQDLTTAEARPLPGTEEGFYPFWSPDGRAIGFFGNDQLKTLDLDTGTIEVIVPVATWGAGGTWGPDGTILYTTHGGVGINTARPGLTQPGPFRATVDLSFPGPDRSTRFSYVHPQFLPDGTGVLFYAQGMPDSRGIYVARFGTQAIKRLVDSEAAGVYAAGRLFFLSDGDLMAQPFDLSTLTLAGAPEIIAEDVPIGGRSAAALASSANRVVHRTGDAGSVRQLTWYDRSGNRLGTVGEPFATGAGAPSISPDGTRVVVNVLVDALGDIATVDLASGALTVVANNAGNDSYPIWSFDGRDVLYSSAHVDFYPMYRQPLDSGEPAQPVFMDPGLRHPMDWSRNGRYLLFRRNTPDLWALEVATGQEIGIAGDQPRVRWPQISPDGRWIAYQSEVSGQSEIHLHGPFEPPSTGARSEPISSGGGAWVRWRADGRELYYASADGTLMAVALEFNADGSTFRAAPPVPLFQVPMAGGPLNRNLAQQYMVADDGQRFLVLTAAPASSPVHVIGSD